MIIDWSILDHIGVLDHLGVEEGYEGAPSMARTPDELFHANSMSLSPRPVPTSTWPASSPPTRAASRSFPAAGCSWAGGAGPPFFGLVPNDTLLLDDQLPGDGRSYRGLSLERDGPPDDAPRVAPRSSPARGPRRHKLEPGHRGGQLAGARPGGA